MDRQDHQLLGILIQRQQLSDLDSYYMKQIEEKYDNRIGDLIEVLPSIYYVKTACLKVNIPIRDPNIKNILDLFKVLMTVLYNLIYRKQKFKITIKIKNTRDQFRVVQFNEKQKESVYYRDNESIPKNDYIDPKVLPYPDTLGGGAGRCIIWSIFSNLGLLDNGSDELYSVISTRKMFEISSYSNKLSNMCLRSKPCGEIIEKMKEGKYEANFEIQDEWRDDIQVQYEDGRYWLSEGKHRVCIAKRFKIDRIPVKITIIKPNKENYVKVGVLEEGVKAFYKEELNCKNILFDCYDKYNRLGLSIDDVRKLNEKGISDSEFVNFIEQTTNKDIVDLANEVYTKIKNEWERKFKNFKSF